jgi:hypothetical protein
MEEGPALQMAPETFNLRLEELAVIDMAFLAAGSGSSSGASSSAAAAAAAANPVLALLYEDNKHARHVKTYTLNLKTRVRWLFGLLLQLHNKCECIAVSLKVSLKSALFSPLLFG